MANLSYTLPGQGELPARQERDLRTLWPNLWCGIVDNLGYLVCRRCREAGHGKKQIAVVFLGEIHASDYCDYCASVLGNMGEP